MNTFVCFKDHLSCSIENKSEDNIFYKYAEEKFSRSIAKNIVKNRPIASTLELVDVIKASVPVKYQLTRHPERPIFQAIRIEVNQELKVLESLKLKSYKKNYYLF